MIRWVRIVALGVFLLAMIALGVGVGLFLVANSGWIAIAVPPWLVGLFGSRGVEVWLPALIAGWLVAVLGAVALLAWSMFYVWRRRQYESLIARLERELAHLRNLPFTNPAPLEDLPWEQPDPDTARLIAGPDSGAEAERGEGEP
jgi:hypothetical protein